MLSEIVMIFKQKRYLHMVYSGHIAAVIHQTINKMIILRHVHKHLEFENMHRCLNCSGEGMLSRF